MKNMLFVRFLCLLCIMVPSTLFAQPGFEDYVFEPRLGKAGITEAEYNADPKAFRTRYFPKLGIPVRREDYFGVHNWYNHGTDGREKVYDGDSSKKTYFACRQKTEGCAHRAVDWLVSYRNYGSNEVINPFPHGATVQVTNYQIWKPDAHESNSLGNFIELTCYLDGNPDNQEKVNELVVRLSHLKKGSLRVGLGQFVNSGQTLAQVGYSGGTSFDVMHTHATYEHMDVTIDPFYGTFNSELNASLLHNQTWIEQTTNWNSAENQKHLTINDAFSLRMPYFRTNAYTFRANHPIEHIRVENWSGVRRDFDLLEDADLENLQFNTYTFHADDGSRNWTVYEVSFRWYQDPATLSAKGEIPFLIENDRGEYSNRVFIQYY